MKRLIICFVCLLAVCSNAYDMKRADIVLLHDGASAEDTALSELYRKEITAVTAGSYDVRFRDVYGDRTLENITSILNNLNREKETDAIISLGLIGARAAVSVKQAYKPVFVPYYLRLTSPVPVKKNIYPTPVNVDFETELDELLRLHDFRKIALLLDDSFRTLFAAEIEQAKAVAVK